MATRSARPKLLAIVGPTASGKSELAIRLAKKFDGEIIAADSRTVYKAMDVGTAKPMPAEQEAVPHYGFDLVEPGQKFSAHQFKIFAQAKIKEIRDRNKLPILVGGTGLYIDSVLFDFQLRPSVSAEQRDELEAMTVEQLQAIIKKSDYEMPENFKNKRYLVRTIERQGQVGPRRQKPPNGSLIVGINPPDEVLKRRIQERSEATFDPLIEETKKLLKDCGEVAITKTAGIPYLAALDFIAGKLNHDEALQKIQSAEWQYARRQRTWFKRNKFIEWYPSAADAFEAVASRVD